MKHIKLFEGFNDGIYDIKDIYSWWSGIDVEENDEWYIIDLDIYLTNLIIPLRQGLKDKTVNFYCTSHKKYEQFKIKNVDYSKYTNYNLVFFVDSTPNVHIVDIKKPIKISKIHILYGTEIDKYNL